MVASALPIKNISTEEWLSATIFMKYSILKKKTVPCD